MGTLEEHVVITSSPKQIHLEPLAYTQLSGRFVDVLLAELRLMLKGRSVWWYGVAAVLFIVSLITPLTIAQNYLLPAYGFGPFYFGQGWAIERFSIRRISSFSLPHIPCVANYLLPG